MMLDERTRKLEDNNMEELIGKIMDVPIERISPDPENLREVFDADDIKDLGLNMKSVGQMDEITLFPKQDKQGNWTGEFDLHDGERRWRAAQMVGIQTLRAKVATRPSSQDLLFKKTSRALQTRILEPEKKMQAVENSLKQLGVWDNHDSWESYREQLGGGAEWPQIMRVLKSRPLVRRMLEEGTVNFTLAQSIARLPQDKQDEAAKYVVVNKISGRFFSTEMVPYLLGNPGNSMAQAFEQTRVGGWRQYIKSPYQHGEEPPAEQQLEDFLEACVQWERAWEVLVHTGLIFKIINNIRHESRTKEALNRIIERVVSTLKKIESADAKDVENGKMLSDKKLISETQYKEDGKG